MGEGNARLSFSLSDSPVKAKKKVVSVQKEIVSFKVCASERDLILHLFSR